MYAFKLTVLLGLFSLGTLWANETVQPPKQHETRGLRLSEEARSFCNASTFGAHVVNDSRCLWRDEVMIGIKSVSPLQVICARLDVHCSGRQAVIEPSEE